jgi:hypothetical protein
MRWRVKKGGKECSRGKVKVVGCRRGGLDGGVLVVEGAREGVRVVEEWLNEGGYVVDMFVDVWL